jgi:dnd system-associated protein 4
MRDIKRPDEFESVVERLTDSRNSEVGVAFFATIMDLLIFAAAIGLACKTRQTVAPGGKIVPFRIFENNQKDGFVYLLALAESQNADALAPANDENTATVFEEYAAGGLKLISSWLLDSPMDISGVQPILSKVQAALKPVSGAANNPDPL